MALISDGGILVLPGKAILFEPVLLPAYLFFVCLMFNLFVIFYGESHLEKLLGPAYEGQTLRNRSSFYEGRQYSEKDR